MSCLLSYGLYLGAASIRPVPAPSWIRWQQLVPYTTSIVHSGDIVRRDQWMILGACLPRQAATGDSQGERLFRLVEESLGPGAFKHLALVHEDHAIG
uniref:hypothetical protein n=1 Tax=Cupriavidus yeoncheonensis TaxID=1462994 RepID=UPI003F497924